VKFTLHFGNNTFPDLAAATKMVKLAEAAGFDSVVAVDHVVFPHNYTSTYPYSPTGRLPGGPDGALPDPLIWMAAMAAVTTKLRFMTGVIILPLRNPLVLAKQVATLDHMSGGRVELGIGVGWLKEEFEALGVPFEKRGKRSDEYVAAMRALWKKEGASFKGEFVNFSEVTSSPFPVKRDVPIVIGGHSEAAAKRAGRIGDGFFPSIGTQVDILPLFDVMWRAADAAGRDGKKIEIMSGCQDLWPGSTKDPRAAVEERASKGIGRLVLPVWRFLPALEDNIARFGETVIKPYASIN
jgi:probable F420-dependent oxidoreductase